MGAAALRHLRLQIPAALPLARAPSEQWVPGGARMLSPRALRHRAPWYGEGAVCFALGKASSPVRLARL